MDGYLFSWSWRQTNKLQLVCYPTVTVWCLEKQLQYKCHKLHHKHSMLYKTVKWFVIANVSIVEIIFWKHIFLPATVITVSSDFHCAHKGYDRKLLISVYNVFSLVKSFNHISFFDKLELLCQNVFTCCFQTCSWGCISSEGIVLAPGTIYSAKILVTAELQATGGT